MNRPHENVVEAQFGPRAKAYVESAVHADGEDLKALEEIVAAVRPKNAVDLGTGGGHVAYRLARFADRVSAVDLSNEMLAAVSATAREKGLPNITTVKASVEALPFTDGAKWTAALSNAGFAIDRLWTSRLRMDFPIWTARMRTPVENVQAIRFVQGAASAATKAHFEIEPDGSFVIGVMVVSVKAEEC